MMGINPTGMFAPKVNANINALSNSRAGYSELDKEAPQNLAPINNQPQYNAAAEQERRVAEQQAASRAIAAARQREESLKPKPRGLGWWELPGYKGPMPGGSVVQNSNPTLSGNAILNHPEIVKRRMLNSDFNNINTAKEWLQRSGYKVG